MPQMSNQTKGNDPPASDIKVKQTPKKKMSQIAKVKAAGFDNFNDFLLSYNLRVYNHDDVKEGQRILDALFEHDESE